MNQIIAFFTPTAKTVTLYGRLFFSLFTYMLLAYILFSLLGIALSINMLDPGAATATDLVQIVQANTKSKITIWTAFVIGFGAMWVANLFHERRRTNAIDYYSMLHRELRDPRTLSKVDRDRLRGE
ncbi:hypothetical protein ACRZ5O_17565 [Pseudomonas protegens]|uniref:hypothetical protein n=1 Tax=Pseudomonas protegens TaxID=380021 RepID=UPI002ACCC17B|nr:hypothetical protein [Pseudomonas putida]HEN8719815.1 hypothetical protein [Pseudomonas putida]